MPWGLGFDRTPPPARSDVAAGYETPDPPCPVCGSVAATSSDDFAPVLFRECSRCGLLFTPAPADEVAVPYSDDTYARLRRDWWTWEPLRGHARKRVKWMKRTVSGGKLLEVGAGQGFFVEAARAAGYDAVGVEPSEAMVEYSRQRLGIELRQGYVEELDLPDRAFDAACLWHVLEHVPTPIDLLEAIRGKLKPDGRIFLEVPNARSVMARRLRSRWAALDPEYHILQFAPFSLRTALDRAGFADVSVQSVIPQTYYPLRSAVGPRAVAGRLYRAIALKTLRTTHPSGGDLLRAVAVNRAS